MYPDLSYFFHDLFGTEVDNWTSIFKTFGVFLALTFAVAYYFLKIEFIRMEKEGRLQKIPIKNPESSNTPLKEGLINGIIGFLVGFKIPVVYQQFEAFKSDPAGIIFSSEGNWMVGPVLGILMGLYYYFNAKNRPPIEKNVALYIMPHQKTGDMLLLAAISGIVGSRLASIIENLDAFFADPLGQLFSGSGLTIYGGLILAFILVYRYVKKIGIPPIHVMDAVAPALLVGYAIGRMGCQFSGDGDWGIENTAPKPDWFIFPDWAWAYDYPRNVADFYQRGAKLPDCVGNFCTHLDPPVFPTPIYEIVGSLLILAFIWSIRKKIKTPGMIFFIYLVLSSFSRFFVEKIRVNPRYDLFGLEWSMSQTISAVLVLIGLIGIFKLRGQSNKPDYTIPDLE
ncbi:MAG: prolipoprotein diacylglyceryl transferase [Saprospiraceae bacterium]|nr:prolipoprotein diacylglyceryl transferase [Saprospiraceae bacterium]